MAFTIQSDLSFVVTTCVTCGVKSALPEELDIQLRRSKAEHYCPNGHIQHYLGKTPEQERDEARSETQRFRDVVESQDKKISRLERKLKKAQS